MSNINRDLLATLKAMVAMYDNVYGMLGDSVREKVDAARQAIAKAERLECVWCGAPMEGDPDELTARGVRFCSRECASSEAGEL